MPDKRVHRGAHPEDSRLFAESEVPRLRAALGDYCWLLSRDYGERSALKVVGDRYQLNVRQRQAIQRSSCTDLQSQERAAKQVRSVADQTLVIDGYNVLTTIETALAGGVVLIGRDETMRDIAGMHGTWRRVEETTPAITLAGQYLIETNVAQVTWLLDRPVSNSGRLRQSLLDIAAIPRWNWAVELVDNADEELIRSTQIVASADSVVLDGCTRWFNLARNIVSDRVAHPWIVDLRSAASA